MCITIWNILSILKKYFIDLHSLVSNPLELRGVALMGGMEYPEYRIWGKSKSGFLISPSDFNHECDFQDPFEGW